jgi:DNA-binding NtrC family response regulator
METILIIDDEIEMCVSLTKLFKAHNYNAIYTSDSRKTFSLLQNNNIFLVITDYKMPDISGINLIKSIKIKYPDTPVIMISGYGSVDTIVTAMKYGAQNFYEKPIKFAKLLSEIEQLKNAKNMQNTIQKIDEIITDNIKMKEIMEIVGKIASTDIPIIITGESGTGKELVANAVHTNSNRSGKPYIKINCASIPETLLESELFGHEKGAFTDARENRKGKFEIAEGGTIFFDEIGEMSINTQAKLLRVIQEKEFERLGSNNIQKMNVRFVAATNKNLKKLVEEGKFREDLYYRLSVVHLEIPTLDERKEDILPLVDYFINDFNIKYNKSIRTISDETISIFLEHSWPGNIRELKNCVERSVIFCDESEISPKDLPMQYKRVSDFAAGDIKSVYDKVTREVILNALNKAKGSKTKAAEILNINRRTLYNKMKRIGLDTWKADKA